MKGQDRCALKVLSLREDLCSHIQPATRIYLSKPMASLPWEAFPDLTMYPANPPSPLALVKQGGDKASGSLSILSTISVRKSQAEME